MNKKKNLNLNDYYDALLDWASIKEIIEDVDVELGKFYGPSRIKEAGIRARKKLLEIHKRSKEIRDKINKQRQDYDSEY